MGGLARLDPTDRRIVDRLQAGVPLEDRPYHRLAHDLDLPPGQLLDRLERLRAPGRIVREISGIFDAPSLGYAQALVALAVPEDKLLSAGQIAASHPGVSHCYQRRDEWNLWLTLAVSDLSPLGLEGTVDRIAALGGAAGRMILPTLRRYKLNVRFRLSQEGLAAGAHHPSPAPSARPAAQGPLPPLSQALRRAVRALQEDLPNVEAPFAPLARKAQMDVAELLDAGGQLLAQGRMRRYAGVVRHRQAGAAENVMVVWQTDQPDVSGPAAAACPAVSHCYLRPAGPNWPYVLYTMIHGPSRQACLEAMDSLARGPAMGPGRALWTVAELAKKRTRYFTDDEQAWESARL